MTYKLICMCNTYGLKLGLFLLVHYPLNPFKLGYVCHMAGDCPLLSLLHPASSESRVNLPTPLEFQTPCQMSHILTLPQLTGYQLLIDR